MKRISLAAIVLAFAFVAAFAPTQPAFAQRAEEGARRAACSVIALSCAPVEHQES